MEPNHGARPPADYPPATDHNSGSEPGDSPMETVESLAEAARQAGAWASDDD